MIPFASPDSPPTFFQRLGVWLIEPGPALLEAEQRRQARNLAIFTLVLLAALLIGAMRNVHPIMIGTSLLMGLSYALARTRYYRHGAFIVALTAALPSFLFAIQGAGGSLFSLAIELIWVPLALFFGGLWLSWVANLTLVTLLSLGLMLLLFVNGPPGSESVRLIAQGVYMVAVSGLLAVVAAGRRQQYQREIQRQREALETQARELRASIVQLEAARREAETASRLKSEFLAIVSHELRTPLNAIIGYADLLLEDPGSGVQGKYRSYLDRIVLSGEHQAALVQDLLDLSMIEAGQMGLHPRPFPPRPLFDAIIHAYEPDARSKGLALLYEYDEALPDQCVGDANRIGQAVDNLLSNALKFTEQGEVRLRVERLDTQHWRIAVSDTGIGITPEVRQLIFEPFRQADASSGRRYPGTGLGLCIVQRLTLLMGGEIALSSEVGQGSRFELLLPLEPVDNR